MTVWIDTKRYQVPHTAPSLLSPHLPSPHLTHPTISPLWNSLSNECIELPGFHYTNSSLGTGSDHKQTLEIGRR